jgi:hypothetical protein
MIFLIRKVIYDYKNLRYSENVKEIKYNENLQ